MLWTTATLLDTKKRENDKKQVLFQNATKEMREAIQSMRLELYKKKQENLELQHMLNQNLFIKLNNYNI